MSENINLNAESSESQCKQIRAWLENGHTITSLEALKLFGCMRLASRIHDLHNQGVDVQKRTIITSTGKRVCEYYL